MLSKPAAPPVATAATPAGAGAAPDLLWRRCRHGTGRRGSRKDTPRTIAGIAISDPDGDPQTVTLNVTQGTHHRVTLTVANGTAIVNSNGTFTYRPATGFVGTDTFIYRVSDGAGGFVDRAERIVATRSIVRAGEIESATLSEARTTGPGVFVLPAVAAIEAELAVASANARTASSPFATSAEPDRPRDMAPTESVAATTDRSMPTAVRRGASPGAPSFTQQLRSAAIDRRANPSAPAMPDADRHAPSMNHRYGPPVLLQRATALAVSIVIVSCSVVQPKPLTGQPLSYAEQEPITGPIGLDTAIARALKYNLDYRLKLMERAPLGYLLLRRPIASVREWTGL